MPLFSYNKAGRFLSVRLARNNLSLLRHGGHRGFAIDWFRTKRSIKSCICPLIVVLASKTMSLCKFLMAKVWGHELLYEGITFKLPNFLQFSKRKQRVTSLAGTMYFSYCSVWAAFLFIPLFVKFQNQLSRPASGPTRLSVRTPPCNGFMGKRYFFFQFCSFLSCLKDLVQTLYVPPVMLKVKPGSLNEARYTYVLIWFRLFFSTIQKN